jgi:hypothetical protein
VLDFNHRAHIQRIRASTSAFHSINEQLGDEMEIPREFFWLFSEGEPGSLSCPEYENVMALCGILDKSEKLFSQTKRAFGNYDDSLAELERRRTRA